MVGRILVAIAVGFLAFVVALVVGSFKNLSAINTYAGLIGLAVAVIWFFGYRYYTDGRGRIL